MSSGSVLLYLAIVVMWLCVLVPMWLRRDRNVFVEVHENTEPYANDEQSPDDESTQILPDPLSGAGSPADASPSPGSGPAGTSAPGAGDGTEAPSPSARAEAARSAAQRRRIERRRRRARQVAKRRRLTFWCVLLLLASVVTAAVQVIPWWGVTPSVVLLGVYLCILRVTVRVDAEQRRAAAKARAERARRARRRAALLEARRQEAEVIDLAAHRDELFDQYAESPPRAVGD
ncbi:hypothetical protein FHS43_006815 [Streptosporangium becharense]|uniref:Uncharacterized protein n=1 Tax=Streptosporangium becharense TaxID=1816182 RepID=A0A7W9IHT3_9ACTN|nr:hypothetical protein [Streptosporangium becharense]MBB2915494.1 hypothetical protein [Streptosporangium becharense]MBB5820999.1 hypothetical protein [Streptosporangium becharense]